MSKSAINKFLKEQFGLANIKLQKDSSGIDTVTLKDNGKMVKGIYLSSHSPMDVTGQAAERVQRTLAGINQALANQGYATHGNGFVVSESAKTVVHVELEVRRYATYARSVNFDAGYQTSYAVPVFTTTTK